jgi:hypothetical protein
MVYVHKKSSVPMDPWPAVRHGGANNLDPSIKGGFLVLWNVDIVHREGAWHYLFEFDVRDSLALSALGQLMGRAQAYPNDMDWKAWLGADCTIISAAVRQEILNMPRDHAQTDAVITGMRAVPNARPVPGRDPNDWFRVELPDDFMLSLPGGA